MTGKEGGKRKNRRKRGRNSPGGGVTERRSDEEKWKMLWTMESGHTDYSSQDALQYVFPLSRELGWIPDVEDVDLWCPIPLVRTHYSELKQRQGRRLLRRSHDSTTPPSHQLKVMLLTSERRVKI